MTITFAGTVIGDDSAGRLCQSLGDVSGTRLAQTENLIGALSKLYLERDTVEKRFAVTIHENTSGSPRTHFVALTRRDDTPSVGELVIEMTVAGVTHTYTAARAKCENITVRPNGAEAEVTYDFAIGRVTYATSDPEDAATPDTDGGDFDDDPAAHIDGGNVADAFAIDEVDAGAF